MDFNCLKNGREIQAFWKIRKVVQRKMVEIFYLRHNHLDPKINKRPWGETEE